MNKITFKCSFQKNIKNINNKMWFIVLSNEIISEYDINNNSILCYGKIPNYPVNMPLEITGEINNTPNGKYIDIITIKEGSNNKEVLINFLIENCIGIGPINAKKIIDKYDKNLFEKIKEEKTINEIVEITKIKRETIEKAINKINNSLNNFKLYNYLSNYGIDNKLLNEISNKNPSNLMIKIKSNPYLMHLEYNLDFQICDKVAYDNKINVNDTNRLKSIIKEIFNQIIEKGHTYITINDFKKRIQYIENKSVYNEQIPIIIYINLLNKDKDYIIENLDGIKIYTKNMWYTEKNIVQNITRINSTNIKYQFNYSYIEEIEKNNKIIYNKEQINSTEILNNSGIKILTGGPGTGKTTTINLIINIYSKMFPYNEILLCAPTGRAAQRMAETTGRISFTLHKALEIQENGNYKNSKNENNPLTADLIIIDEMSMVDIKLFNILLAATKSNALVLLVGDEDQLASVGPGNVLHDLLKSNVIKTYKLTEIFRQAAECSIINNYYLIRDGKNNLKQDSQFQIITVDTKEELKNITIQEFEKYYDKNNVNKVQILSPIKKGDSGTLLINKNIQQLINKSEKNLVYKNNYFKENDKIIMNKNNYLYEYYNGDIGILREINKETNLNMFSFNKKYKELPIISLEDTSLAYAITIHKSQGSEYPIVIIILPNEYDIMLRRDLLFTAVSRAKEKVIIIEQKGCINKCIQNNTKNPQLIRNTTLYDKLINKPYNINK